MGNKPAPGHLPAYPEARVWAALGEEPKGSDGAARDGSPMMLLTHRKPIEFRRVFIHELAARRFR